MILMECITLAGISRRVLKDLMENRIRTLEIRSPRNFFSLEGISSDDRVFLTESSATDVVPGTSGLLTGVVGVQIVTHRMIQSGEFYYEELESQAARVQLHLLGIGRVRSVKSNDIGHPFVLDVDEVRYCNAR